MEFNLQESERKHHFSTFLWLQGWKKKFLYFMAHLQDIPIHILKYHLSTPWNVDRVQVTFLIIDRKRHMTSGRKMKIPNPYCTSARHALNHILEFQLSTPENVDVVQVTNFTEKWKHRFSTPHLTSRDKMKIPIPYCTSTRHIQ